jgi:hypothetical protein
MSFGTRADRGETDFSNTLSAGRQQRTKTKKESNARLFESELSDQIVFQSKIKLEERYLCF